MELTRLETSLARFEQVPGVVARRSRPVVVSCADANVVMVIAALRDQLSGPIGVWLEVSPAYPAALAARDVKTLGWLVRLDHVVVSAAERPRSHADVVSALLTDDEVTFENDVATLRHAYNRPAPPNRIVVWSWDGDALVHDDTVLRELRRATSDAGALTTLA